MKIKETIATYNRDPFRKSHLRTLYEALQWMIKEKELPNYYFSHLLYKKNVTNYLDYIGREKSRRIRREVYKPNNILDDKILFQKFIQKNNIPGPVWLAQVEDGHFSGNGFSEKLTTPERLAQLLEVLIDSCSVSESIFLKPSYGIGGGGTYKINKDKLINHEEIHKLFADLQNDTYIIQEALVQHEAINSLNPSSINTLRVHSYRKPDGSLDIASVFVRIGQGGAHVDNGSSGGIFAPVDVVAGTIDKYGYSLLKNGGKTFSQHPDTGIVFEGFILPYFKEAMALVSRAASLFENNIIGWDVAITVNGPILIEGNHNPHVMMAQTACGGFRKHPVYEKLFKEYL